MSPEFCFASTFPTGFEKGVQDALKSRDPQVHTDIIQDGLVIYTSRLSPEAIRNLPFLNNTFLVLSQMKFNDTTNMPKVVDSLFRKVQLPQLAGVIQSLGAHTFRFMVSRENQPQPMQPKQRENMERIVSQSLKLHVNRDNPGVEFWFLSRRDGTSFCGLRLTRREKAEKGELGREISYLLNSISEPKKKDVFLDPFAGSGAIPFSRAKYFPYGKVIAIDSDPKKVAEEKHRLKRFQRTEALQEDALKMKSIQDQSIDVVVTDPPWGVFEKLSLEPNVFHLRMLQEINRVLKPGGRAVILTARKDEMEEAARKLNWQATKTINVLVSGKKANIYYFVKP